MWTCPKCERVFKTINQSHYCGVATLDDIFAKTPDHLLLAFDTLLQRVLIWEPCSVGPAKNCVVFSNNKAWLILRPMSKVLDLKFYHSEMLDSHRLHSVKQYGKKYAHHIRIAHEDELNDVVIDLLRKGFEYALR